MFKFFPDAKVDFFDIDPEANKNCYQNAEINLLVDSQFRLLLPEVKDRILPDYDVVFANILECILIEEKEFLIERLKVGSLLILSGLLKHQMPNIINSYASKNLVMIRQIQKGDWGAILFRKECE